MEGQKNILITGASGLIGGHVARYFSSMGHNIFCLVRNNSDISFIEDLPVTYRKGDITDLVSLESAFARMDCIIHTASKVTDWGERNDFFRVNVVGTVNVLKAALHHNAGQVIITGSVSSYGEENSLLLKNERSPYNSHYPYAFDRCFPSGMNFYRDSKALSTREAIDFATLNDINLVILEPVWVYGENERHSGFYEFISAVKKGRTVMPGGGTNLFHVIHARDLARAYYLAFLKCLKGVHRFIIGNETTDPMHRIYTLYCREAGLKMPLFVPKALIYPLAFIQEWIGRASRREVSPMLTRARVNLFYDTICYDPGKARSVLGFTPSIPLEEGIRDTVQWYLQKKWL